MKSAEELIIMEKNNYRPQKSPGGSISGKSGRTEEKSMAAKNIDWANLGFGYMKTDYRYVSNYKNGSWDQGALTTDDQILLNECACVFQYAQTCFEGLKAYTTEDGHIVTFRPDLNGERMENSAKRLEMPVFPKERFVEAVTKVVEVSPCTSTTSGFSFSSTSLIRFRILVVTSNSVCLSFMMDKS